MGRGSGIAGSRHSIDVVRIWYLCFQFGFPLVLSLAPSSCGSHSLITQELRNFDRKTFFFVIVSREISWIIQLKSPSGQRMECFDWLDLELGVVSSPPESWGWRMEKGNFQKEIPVLLLQERIDAVSISCCLTSHPRPQRPGTIIQPSACGRNQSQQDTTWVKCQKREWHVQKL